MINSFEQTTVGEIVARDFRTAGILEQFGIDFCCGGWRWSWPAGAAPRG